jgi:succinate dehydrogenase/fumarate reductase flavoprotein subunit
MTQFWATSASTPEQTIETDVLIIGGGMAAAWAAIGAARGGAQVVLVDKGFVGSSGVTATAGPNHWWVPPDPELRAAAVEKRDAQALGLAERRWMHAILDATWRNLPQLAGYYPFAPDGSGRTYYSGVRGPEYMRALRRYAEDLGVRILDHHPALELLLHPDGSAAGARGYARLQRHDWRARAGTVVLATGGCAFRSGLLGSYNNTGDGYLMAAEAGAELSGMEFSACYTLSPAWASTRTLPYTAARFYGSDGAPLDIAPHHRHDDHHRDLAKALTAGPVFADLHDAPDELKPILRRIQPATPPPFERRGLDLFKDRFQVTLFGEGTIRGTGGLRIVDEGCQTTVRGLHAAGDTATRELVTGAVSGGGAVNSAWALSSGLAAGEAAASRALRDGRRSTDSASAAGQAALRPTHDVRAVDGPAAIRLAGEQILDPIKALWRTDAGLRASQAILDGIWREIAAHSRAQGLQQVAAREAAAVTATARWCNAAALARGESRGLHLREDAPAINPALARRLLVGGLDAPWTRWDAAAVTEAAA